MCRHQMAATELAELAMAQFRLVVGCNVLRSLEHLHGPWWPERERIDRAAGPRAARPTMAVAHCVRLASHADLDRAAEARPRIRTGHDRPPVSHIDYTRHGTGTNHREGRQGRDHACPCTYPLSVPIPKPWLENLTSRPREADGSQLIRKPFVLGM